MGAETTNVRPANVEHRLLGGIAVTAGFFIDVMGSTSVFAAGPAIERSIGLGQDGLQWTFTAATLPAGALLLVGGRLADVFGARRTFLFGLGLFALASLGCGLSDSAGPLVAARAAQGVAGALLMPAALSLLLGLYPDESERRRALAAWSAVGGAGATAGLFYGGLVTQILGWSWIFWINVPAAAAIGAIALAVLPARGPSGDSRPVDLAGVVTSTAGLAAVIYGATQSPRHGWTDPVDVGSLAAGGLLLVGFAVVERRSEHPMLPPALLARAGVLRGTAVLLTAGLAVDGLLFLLTLYLQVVRGYSSEQFAATAALMTVSSIGAAFVAERMIGRCGPRPVATVGLSLLTFASVLFIAGLRGNGSTLFVVAGMVVFGLGMGGAYTAGSVQSLAAVPSQDAGIASGVQNIAFAVGSTLGVAMVSTVATATGKATGVTAGVAGLSAGFLAVASAVVVGSTAATWPRSRQLRSPATDIPATNGPLPPKQRVQR